ATAEDVREAAVSPAGRLGTALAEGLSALSGPEPASAAGRLAARAAEFPDRPVLGLYGAFASYSAALPVGDTTGLARWSAGLARAAATPPVSAAERMAVSEAALARRDVDAALSALDEAVRAEGDASWIEVARSLAASEGKRLQEALAALD